MDLLDQIENLPFDIQHNLLSYKKPCELKKFLDEAPEYADIFNNEFAKKQLAYDYILPYFEGITLEKLCEYERENKGYLLTLASEMGDLILVKRILKQYFSEKYIPTYMEAVSVAIKNKRSNVVDFLLNHRPEFLNLNRFLPDAAEIGDILLVDKLIEMGAKDVHTALIFAAKGGHRDLMEKLINLYPPTPTNINEALEGAAEGGHLDIINWLRELGANDYSLALIGAAKGGHMKIVEMMLELGVIQQPDLDAALFYASAGGYTEIVKFLFNLGARNNEAMELAADNGNIEIVEFFVQNGISETLNAIYDASESGHLNVVKFLISHIENDLKKNAFNTALVQGAFGGHFDIVKYAIKKGADRFDDAIINAVHGRNLDIIEYLLKNTNVMLSLNEIMKEAADVGNINIVERMIALGADDLNNALLSAAHEGYLDLVKFLVEAGATELNEPVSSAADNRYYDIVEYLLQSGANDYEWILKNVHGKKMIDLVWRYADKNYRFSKV